MKKTLLFLLIISCCFSFCACKNKDYLKANETEGDFSVSVPSDAFGNGQNGSAGENGILNNESLALVGVWKLENIISAGSVTTYNNSFYVFTETGSYTASAGSELEGGRFFALDGILYFGSTPVKYTISGNTLILETETGRVHTLTKAKSQVSE